MNPSHSQKLLNFDFALIYLQVLIPLLNFAAGLGPTSSTPSRHSAASPGKMARREGVEMAEMGCHMWDLAGGTGN